MGGVWLEWVVKGENGWGLVEMGGVGREWVGFKDESSEVLPKPMAEKGQKRNFFCRIRSSEKPRPPFGSKNWTRLLISREQDRGTSARRQGAK